MLYFLNFTHLLFKLNLKKKFILRLNFFITWLDEEDDATAAAATAAIACFWLCAADWAAALLAAAAAAALLALSLGFWRSLRNEAATLASVSM